MTAATTASRGRALAIAALLGVTQTVGYGTLYYSYGVLAPDMASDTGYSLTAIYGWFSVALAASGFVAPRAGQMMDRKAPALLMTAGSLTCAAMMALCALTHGKAAFAILTILVEVSSILVLYEAAFVAAARLMPSGGARQVITGITFIAGFASTIFWPLTDWLSSFLSWREVYLVYAGLQLAVCVPLHALLWWRFLPVEQAADSSDGEYETGQLRDPAARKKVFLLLLIGFAGQAFVMSAIHLHLIGLLGGLGLAGSAAFIGAFLGPSQVAARVLEFAGSARFSIRPALIFCALSMPLALFVLIAGAPSQGMAIAFAVLFGAGQGLSYVVRAILPLLLFGRKGYGELTGWISSVRLFVSAFAPFATAFLFENAGAGVALWGIAVLSALSGLVLVAIPLGDTAKGRAA